MPVICHFQQSSSGEESSLDPPEFECLSSTDIESSCESVVETDVDSGSTDSTEEVNDMPEMASRSTPDPSERPMGNESTENASKGND